MAKNAQSTFPSQAVSDARKASKDYGLEVAKAIEQDWFGGNSGSGRYDQNRTEFHRLRLYARGEQSIRKYKDEFSINGDLSYLNLDWKPVPIIPKFVDIIVNGMQDRIFSIKAVAQDPISTDRRTKFVEAIERDMNTQDLLAQIEGELGVNARNVEPDQLPETSEELELYMSLDYKQGIEIAIEQAIDNVLMSNKYTDLKRRIDYDLAVLGIGAAKHTFNNTDGIKLDYVDPANLVYSYTEDPTFSDVYYFGEVKRVRINELVKQFPDMSNTELEELGKSDSSRIDYAQNYTNRNNQEDDNNTIEILYFNWKTFEKAVHKIKETASGADKAIKKDDTFDPPKDSRARFEKVAQSREVIYEGAYALGKEKLLGWKKATNMVRPDSNTNKVMMDYVVSAPRLYKGRIESLVSRMITYADLIQLTHLKLQQSIQRMTPEGIYVDADGLAEIDLGNGTAYNPQEALNMYFQTGSIIGRSLTVDGDPNGGKVPIQELPGGGGQAIQTLVGAYNHYLQMIRDITGVSEARDGSTPDQYSLVGVQKLAAANSNTATRHVLYGGLSVTTRLAECVSTRFKDVLEFHPTKEAFIGAIGRFSVGSLKELNRLHMHDFGIFIELEPDEDEKQLLEANIQAALAKESIHLEDAIDVREVKNLKLANQLLKYRRVRKQKEDQAIQEQNLRAQSEAQSKGAIEVENAKAQAAQAEVESTSQIEQVKNQLAIKKMEIEAQTKKELMQFEFDLNVKLKEMELGAQKQLAELNTENQKELVDKKEEGAMARENIKAKASASNVSGPPKTSKPKKSFESKGNDTIGGGFDLERFEPK